MLVIVAYDIPDDKRRLQLSNFLEGYGRRVQESVFECFMNLDQMRQLHKQTLLKVEPDEDNIRFYWLPTDGVEKVLTIGSPLPMTPPDAYII
ncbi:MAG: CRISPR-associated endonuclease Cas2 [Acaryochloris sp. RU_4_1]|nr:CRISPR-associated endonuclease Cas2 [Acaryochloris sp. RU_4_1]NJR55402.1 CRISPR-associated endonuclease Cas2 [Acaryochloris sp. CRU_2_0]